MRILKKSLVLVVTFASLSASAAKLKSAVFNEATQAIDLVVSYGGGCEEHNFTLKVGMCLESLPMQCSATLIDSGAYDGCEAMFSARKVSIPLSEVKGYYGTAYITVRNSDETEVRFFVP